ncbi:MAG TPA: TfoX/Sxy family protein [Gemmatimonadales bacterium]|nr:TfoX/Sxy family protein [Gemmatimonadales bacterium]HMU62047.1 TfoX/Sxy family protein [Gemmatimonadales bacterium]
MARPMSDAYRLVQAAIADLPNVTTRKMFGAEAYFHGRRMFAFLREDLVVLKLPESQREELLEAKAARPFLVNENAGFGRWVEIPGTGEAAERAVLLVQSAYAAAKRPDRDGPRRRRRRRAAKTEV